MGCGLAAAPPLPGLEEPYQMQARPQVGITFVAQARLQQVQLFTPVLPIHAAFRLRKPLLWKLFGFFR